MSITLVAVVLALVLGHVAPSLVAAFRRHAWYDAWLRWLGEGGRGSAGFWGGRYGIALALAPVLLVVALLQWLLDGPLYGLPGLLFDIAVLVYAWGPRDLDVDVEAIIDAHDAPTRRAAIARLGLTGEAAALDGPALVEAVFANALRRWFGVLFWFCVLGPFGALLYRASVLAAECDDSQLAQETASGAKAWLAILEWPVSQLATLALALVGNFDSVMGAWREEGAFGLHGGLLGTAARASVRSEIAEEVADYTESGVPASTALAEAFGELPELRDAMSMVWRILVLWLAVIALFVIAGWVS